jgi:hypothetical protein
VALMRGLERFINDARAVRGDPLIKMALIHHQFESIHPFYDGNGRTGRILNVLYLVKEGLLDIPVLYLSSHIVRTKADYYRLLQTVREQDTLGRVGALHAGRGGGHRRPDDHHHPRHQGGAVRLQAPHPRGIQVLQPGLDQQPVHAPVHQDRVRAAGLGVSR